MSNIVLEVLITAINNQGVAGYWQKREWAISGQCDGRLV